MSTADNGHRVDPLAALLHPEMEVRLLDDLHLACVGGLANDRTLAHLLPGLDLDGYHADSRMGEHGYSSGYEFPDSRMREILIWSWSVLA